MKILITGSTGFVGSALCKHLSSISDYAVVGTGRGALREEFSHLTYFPIDYSQPEPDWSPALDQVEVVVHLAARAHVMSELSVDPMSEFRAVNVLGTLALARQALGAGVKRFVYISSIGVNGSFTEGDRFTEQSTVNPHAQYALSKWEAEESLRKLLQGTSMELVIVRPPLVYAAHAPGNFQRLLKLAATGVPLPLGLVRNSRSMIALENLVGFITLCIKHPQAANQLFLVSDHSDISTPDLIRYIGKGMGRRMVLIPLPVSFIRIMAVCVGKQNLYTQLCRSLVIDSSKATQLLGWVPTVNAEQALVAAGREFINNRASRT